MAHHAGHAAHGDGDDMTIMTVEREEYERLERQLAEARAGYDILQEESRKEIERLRAEMIRLGDIWDGVDKDAKETERQLAEARAMIKDYAESLTIADRERYEARAREEQKHKALEELLDAVDRMDMDSFECRHFGPYQDKARQALSSAVPADRKAERLLLQEWLDTCYSVSEDRYGGEPTVTLSPAATSLGERTKQALAAAKEQDEPPECDPNCDDPDCPYTH